jgi:hypothetical protein
MIDSTFVSAVIIGTVSLVGIGVNSWIAWRNQSKEWNRQKQWELRRDAVLKAIDALNEVVHSLSNLDGCFSVDRVELHERQDKADEIFFADLKRLYGAILFVDVTIKGRLSTELKDYLKLVHSSGKKIIAGEFYTHKSEEMKAIANKENDVMKAASETLGIKNVDDLLLIEDRN